MSKSAKLAIGLAVIAYIAVGFFAVEYAAGVAYFLVSKTAPTDVGLDTWASYWHWYSADPVQRKRLQLAGGLALFLVYVVPMLIWGATTGKRRSLHGDARFANSGEVRKAKLFAEQGVIVGKYEGRYLIYSGQQFVLLAAPTRSGKGVAIVIPNLLNYSGSVVVLDIKLENFKYTSKFRKQHGQQVYLFNPFAEDGHTHRWNPLDGISRDKNFRVGDTLAISQALYPAGENKDSFWNDSARNLFLGLTLYLLDTEGLPCTLGELLRQSSGKGRPIRDYLQELMVGRQNGPHALSEECLDALNRFCATSENTMASILATFNAPLTIFANPIVDAATSASDFDVTDVRKKRMSIYLGIQPNRLADAALLMNLFFSQLINLNTKQLPADNPDLKHPCLLILDEFTAIGKVAIIAKSVAYIAGYNIRLLPIIQSISQLESVYGEKDTRTFVTNHALQILYPPREQKDANEYSEMLGTFTEKAISTGESCPRAWGGNSAGSNSENTSDQRRALMLPQELKELGQDREIIIVENTKPILCDKARYFSDETFIDRLKALSPVLKALGKAMPTQAQLEDAAFMLGQLSVPVPKVDFDRHVAKLESRSRPMTLGEAIAVGRLVTTGSDLPKFADSKHPLVSEAEAVNDAFFADLVWANPTGEAMRPLESASIGEVVDEPNVVVPSRATTPARASPPSRMAGNSLEPPQTARRSRAVDISAIDI